MAAKRLLDKEEIRRLTDLVEVVSTQVALSGSGRRLRGLCPFHPEKTPSFHVDTEKGLWHCFGCKAGGDAFRFVELAMGLSFPEAAQWLARRLGGEYRSGSPRQTSEFSRLAEMNSQAAALYRRLLSSPQGAEARAYLEKRGFSSQDALKFGLGYAPAEWERLFRDLRDRGFSEEEILRSGLCLQRETGGGYDRFRHRLIFPIYDLQERVIGFGGRALTKEEEPKYLNSPETPLFQKGRTLYGLSWAAKAVASRRRAIIVEGYFDLMRCHLAGFEEAAATLGTALTPAHLEMLRRRQAEKVFLAFDADSAGLQAALRSREFAGAAEMKVLAVTLPAGHDPDTLLLSQGVAPMEKALAEAKPLLELALEGILAKYEGQPENARLGLLKEGAEVLTGVKDIVDREFYISWLAERYCGKKGENVAKVEQMLLSQVGSLAGTFAKRTAASWTRQQTAVEALASQVSHETPQVKLERRLLSCLLAQPTLVQQKPEMLRPEDFAETAHQQLAEAISSLARQGEAADAARLSIYFEGNELLGLVAELAVAAEPWMEAAEAEKLLGRIRAQKMEQRRRELSRLVENEKEEEKRRLLQAELHTLTKEKSRQVGRWVVGE